MQAGAAYNLEGRNQNGLAVAADTGIAPENIKFLRDIHFPFGVHTSADAIIGPDRKSLGWGTGLVVYRSPRPVSAYVLGGTLLHADLIGDGFSFGGVSPYGEVGVMASVPARYGDGGGGMITTLGLEGATYFNYLAGGGNGVEPVMLVKLGVGYERF